tara:strand:+ start:404 stop:610 length:207 start_codon:yes stop_codon:yes gene_type:complete
LLIKLIIVLFLAWIGYSLIKRLNNPKTSNSSNGQGQKMIVCEVCDTHVPESDVIVKNGKNFCSKEHAE